MVAKTWSRVFNPEQYYGQKYGRLTIVEFSRFKPEQAKFRHHLYWCECECGNRVESSIYLMRSGNTSSCGCFRRELMTKHGMHGSPEYQIWEGVIQRGTGNDHTKYYADRGITVCDEWSGEGGFKAFYDHIGPRPSPQHSVDRIDNDRGYEPGNVRWATSKEQARNTSRNRFFDVNGERLCLTDACAKYGLPFARVYYRLKRGWSIERALDLKEVA